MPKTAYRSDFREKHRNLSAARVRSRDLSLRRQANTLPPDHHDQVSHLEQLVLLAKVDRLLPAIVALVQVGANASELDQLVLLQTLRQRDVVKVVEGVDGCSQALVVFLFDQQVVQRLVDCLVVVVLSQNHGHN